MCHRGSKCIDSITRQQTILIFPLLESFLNEEMFILKALGNIAVDTSYVRHTWAICNWPINFRIISLDKEPWETGSGSDNKQELPQSPPGESRILPERLLTKYCSLFPGQTSQFWGAKASFSHRAQHLPQKSPGMPGRCTGKQTGIIY